MAKYTINRNDYGYNDVIIYVYASNEEQAIRKAKKLVQKKEYLILKVDEKRRK
jgi:hypothetical protein